VESCETDDDGVLSLPGFCRPASGIVDTSAIHSLDARNPVGGFKFSRSTLSRRRRNASLLRADDFTTYSTQIRAAAADRVAAHRKLDQRRAYLCAAGFRKGA
jgi:hypothetical protein